MYMAAQVLTASSSVMSASFMGPAVRNETITDDAPVSFRSLRTAAGFSLMDSRTHWAILSIIINND